MLSLTELFPHLPSPDVLVGKWWAFARETRTESVCADLDIAGEILDSRLAMAVLLVNVLDSKVPGYYFERAIGPRLLEAMASSRLFDDLLAILLDDSDSSRRMHYYAASILLCFFNKPKNVVKTLVQASVDRILQNFALWSILPHRIEDALGRFRKAKDVDGGILWVCTIISSCMSNFNGQT